MASTMNWRAFTRASKAARAVPSDLQPPTWMGRASSSGMRVMVGVGLRYRNPDGDGRLSALTVLLHARGGDVTLGAGRQPLDRRQRLIDVGHDQRGLHSVDDEAGALGCLALFFFIQR